MDFSIGKTINSSVCGNLFQWNDAWIVTNGERRASHAAKITGQGAQQVFDWDGVRLSISFSTEGLFSLSVENRTSADLFLNEVVPFEFLLSGKDWYSELNPQCESLRYWTFPLERQNGNAGLQQWGLKGNNDISWWMTSLHETHLNKNVLLGVVESPAAFIRFDIKGVVWTQYAPQARIVMRCLTFAGNKGVRLRSGTKLEIGTFVFLVSDNGLEIFQKYRELVAKGISASQLKDKGALSGWCDWYYYYGTTDNVAAMQNLEAAGEYMKPYGAELFMQDEGWSKTNNDKFNKEGIGEEWEANSKFPEGMAEYASKVTTKGFTPGLWFRPFIVDGLSPLMKEEWVYPDKRIDITHPKALEYLGKLVAKFKEWGFRYLKYDFLAFDLMHDLNCLDFPADLVSYKPYDDQITTAQAYRRAIQAMRDAAGDEVYFLGCNTYGPLGWGIHNAQRTGDDVTAKSWKRTMATGIQSIASQWFLNGAAFACDPDCLMVHEPLSLNAARAFAVLTALTGHASIFSDDLPNLSVERLDVLRKSIPVIKEMAIPLDLLDENCPTQWWLAQERKETGVNGGLLALFNWQGTEKHFSFPLSKIGLKTPCELFDVITGLSCGIVDQALAVHIPQDTFCKLLAIRPRTGIPMVIASDRHFATLQMELEKAIWNGASLQIKTSSLPCKGPFRLYLSYQGYEPVLNELEDGHWLKVEPSSEYTVEFRRKDA